MQKYLIFAGIGLVAVVLAVVAMRPPSTGARSAAPSPAVAERKVAEAPRATRPAPRADAPGARDDVEDAAPGAPPPPERSEADQRAIEGLRGTPEGQALTRTLAPWTQVSMLLEGADYPDATLLHEEASRLVADLKAWHDEPMRFNYQELEGRQLGLMAHIRQATRGDPEVEKKLAVVEQALADARADVQGGADMPPLPPPSHQHLGGE